MPIMMAPVGQNLRIVKILTDEKTKKHLGSLGITVNATLKIMSSSGGSIICLVQKGRLALDKSVAARILVA